MSDELTEYEITRDGGTYTVLLDEETARAWGLLPEKKGGKRAEEHATAPKAETRQARKS